MWLILVYQLPRFTTITSTRIGLTGLETSLLEVEGLHATQGKTGHSFCVGLDAELIFSIKSSDAVLGSEPNEYPDDKLTNRGLQRAFTTFHNLWLTRMLTYAPVRAMSDARF